MTKRSITLSFPWFPKEVAPNVKTKAVALADGTRKRKAIGWGEKAAATKGYRYMCRMLTREQTWIRKERAQIPPLTGPVLATTTFYVDSKRRYDMRNLDASLKALWDGVVDSGLLVDDDYKHLRHAESKLVVERGGTKRVEVTLEELE